jgi:inorganic triphosphatase YgiF
MNPAGAPTLAEQEAEDAVQPTDHAVETEIKLRLSPQARTALERHPTFNPPCASAPHTQQEVTTYFDTPDGALSSKRVTLRVRRGEQGRRQTLKVAGGDDRQPLQRGEWEWRVESDLPDLSRLAETPSAPLLRTIDSASLRPVFTTDIQRTTRLLYPDDCTTVEAAFDEGHIITDGSSVPVSEMELELKTGRAYALYRLALDLLDDIPLGLEAASKAERGFWLHTGEPPKASKASHVSIDNSAPTAEAFKRVVGSVLAHLLANVGSAERADVEGVHQTRVAIRRMRAALALFKPHLPPVTLSGFNEELCRLGGMFGEARDWDVFVFETLPAAAKDIPEPARLHPLRDAAKAQCDAVHRAVAAELGAPPFARLVIGMAAWIVDGGDASPPLGDTAMDAPIEDTAGHLQTRMWHKVAKRGQHLDHASAEQLHALRKAVKKLRYGIEFLAGLYRHKQIKAYLGSCKDLQELLGTVNDAAVTLAILERLRAYDEDLGPAIDTIRDWVKLRAETARRRVSKPWHELCSADRFWH